MELQPAVIQFCGNCVAKWECPVQFWDASRGQITVLCQLHSSCSEPHLHSSCSEPHHAKPTAVCIPFVLCNTCNLSLQCLSRCPEMQPFSDFHLKRLKLFKLNDFFLVIYTYLQLPTLLCTYICVKDFHGFKMHPRREWLMHIMSHLIMMQSILSLSKCSSTSRWCAGCHWCQPPKSTSLWGWW